MAANNKQVNKQPVGYGMLAAVLDCDPNFLICRKYGRLHVRVLLHLQDELAELEEELEDLDQEDYKENERQLTSRRLDDEISGERKELLRKINSKLIEYGIYPKCATNLRVSHFCR